MVFLSGVMFDLARPAQGHCAGAKFFGSSGIVFVRGMCVLICECVRQKLICPVENHRWHSSSSNFSFGGAWVLVYGGSNKHSRDALSQLLIFPPPAETLISNLCVWFSLCAFPCRGETRGRGMNVRVLK